MKQTISFIAAASFLAAVAAFALLTQEPREPETPTDAAAIGIVHSAEEFGDELKAIQERNAAIQTQIVEDFCGFQPVTYVGIDPAGGFIVQNDNGAKLTIGYGNAYPAIPRPGERWTIAVIPGMERPCLDCLFQETAEELTDD